MKKFLTALLALILALAMAFAMVACEETNKDPNNGNVNDTEQGGNNTGDNTGDNTGGNEEDESLQPVDAKLFAQTILEQISTAEGFSVTLNAKADGTVTAPNEAGESANTTIKESVSDTYTLDEAMSYLSNTLTVFDDIWSLFAGIDAFSGTVQPDLDNSGYEYSFTVSTEQVQTGWNTVNNFLQTTGKESSLIELLDPLFPAPEEDTEQSAAYLWLVDLLAPNKTLGEFITQLNSVLPDNYKINKLVGIAAGIIGFPIDLDMILGLKIKFEANENGELIPVESDKTLAETTMSELLDPVLATVENPIIPGMPLTYQLLGIMPALLQEMTVTEFYDWLVLIMESMSITLPTSNELNGSAVETAIFSVTVKTDKDMKLTSFSASGSFEGSITIREQLYAADITATASGTFGYEAVSAGTNDDAGSEALAA